MLTCICLLLHHVDTKRKAAMLLCTSSGEGSDAPHSLALLVSSYQHCVSREKHATACSCLDAEAGTELSWLWIEVTAKAASWHTKVCPVGILQGRPRCPRLSGTHFAALLTALAMGMRTTSV
jgi:hypothetical protein